MSVNAEAGPGVTLTRPRDRSRHVWVVLVLSTLGFFSLCGLAGTSLYGYLSGVTVPQEGSVELLKGSQLTVQRRGDTASVLITSTTTLQEGDQARTGADSEAFIELFDKRITLRTYFDTSLTLDTLRTSRFFEDRREMRVTLHGGTVIVATGPPSDFTDENYGIVTPDGLVLIPPQSRVRVSKASDTASTSVVVEQGRASVFWRGERRDLATGRMIILDVAAEPGPDVPALDELVSNGSFKDAPTREADLVENGGLGIAAWTPIREPGSGSELFTNLVEIATDEVPPNVIYFANFQREGPTNQYGRLGIRQEINRPVDYLETIELNATVRVVQQSEVIGGPTGDIYPLTIKVEYTDAEGKPRTWVRSFYYGDGPDGAEDSGDVLRVEQNRWQSLESLSKENKGILKPAAPGAGQPDIINAIEIYGKGPLFNSSINNISITGH